MRKLEQIQLNKLISAYGGVGSIIETNTNGSLIILPYDQWICFVNVNQNPMEIRDNRLLSYVRIHGYPNVTRLVPIPDNDLSNSVYSATNANIGTTVSSKYFPEWYYCPHCRRLYKLSEWEFHWNEKFKKDAKKNGFRKKSPSCYYCSYEKNKGKDISRYPLQQIRFVMASLSGDMEDVPFDRLWDNNPNGGAWQVDNIMNAARNLRYRSRRGDGDGLQNLFIENADTHRRTYLSQIERNYIIKDDNAYKMAVRGSQSLYFPEIVRSLYIPMEADDNINAQNTDELDLHEFRYLTNDDNFINNMIVKDDLVVKRRQEPTMPFISRISAIEKLKETSVLLSYTRMGKYGEPRQWYNVGQQAESQGETAMSKRPFSDEFQPTYMPAVESYGEGVLFEVDLNSNSILSDDYETFVHTFCHIVMKEMEFQCGYPLTSLKEKIYIDNDNSKGGFLIYTIAGSEGSYGGLISLTQNGKIIDLINRGAERARYCPNDPICSSEHEAHCFACLDLPETACIKFNAKLNRKLFLERWFNPRPNGLVL